MDALDDRDQIAGMTGLRRGFSRALENPTFLGLLFVAPAELLLLDLQLPQLRKDRPTQGGGVCLYIKEELAYNPRTDLENGRTC